MKATHAQIRKWMQASSIESRLDAFGNLIGRHSGALNGSQQADVFMIGSHLDTVVNAGRFDGPMGVMLGLGVAELIRESDIALPFDIDVVGFSEEEGVRFGFPFIGSLGISGQFDPGDLDRVDVKGVTMRQALADFGCDPDKFEADSYRSGSRGKVIGFMEAHLEQATRLEQSNSPVGIVTSIAGQTRGTIVIEGVAGHAGTVPHDQRRDALAGAAKLILDIEKLGQETPGLYATVGAITAKPSLSNVICGHVELMLDLRHELDEVRLKSLKTIDLMIRELSATRDLAARIHRADHSPAVPMDGALTRSLETSAGGAQSSVEMMVSGAGHDAMVMAKLAPSCMLFVRCRDGVSHHPDEFVAPEDIRVALEVMTNALIQISET
ncbi:Hydantoin utilization protein C [Mariniblastus fucicola]|uniref:Hydantoin utilization protein C n=2 Tax=Mariniblastus fucicola TaxID=980251 RepID=A0A5B9P6G0_9BACT|nr:Hydantoin utilization protein C [Mariniblastus fucicola]